MTLGFARSSLMRHQIYPIKGNTAKLDFTKIQISATGKVLLRKYESNHGLEETFANHMSHWKLVFRVYKTTQPKFLNGQMI